jgi:hypothetical protein
LGVRSSQLGDLISVKPGETVLAPPRGRLWHSPAWANGSIYQLHDLIRRPVLEPGDMFGLHPKDPLPLPPTGTELIRVLNPTAPAGQTAAHLYKVIMPPAMSAVLALPKPKPPTLRAYAVAEPLPREEGKRFQVAYVDGRNLQRMVGALVAA